MTAAQRTTTARSRPSSATPCPCRRGSRTRVASWATEESGPQTGARESSAARNSGCHEFRPTAVWMQQPMELALDVTRPHIMSKPRAHSTTASGSLNLRCSKHEPRCKHARTSLLSLLKGRRHHRRWAGAASSAAGGRWMGRSGACAERRTVLSRCRARLGAFWTKARGQDGVRGRGASAPAARPATTRGGERKRAGVQCRHRHWLPCCSTPSK